MSGTTKGTPRKRPYDVKRKLARAAAKVPGLVRRDFGTGRTDGKCCVIGAYNKAHGRHEQAVTAAAEALGLETSEVWSIICGFDGERYDDNWGRIGEELAREFGVL